MKFKLSTSGTFYHKRDKEKLEKLGFSFKTTQEVYGSFTHAEFYLNRMADPEPTIEINTLDELLSFQDSVDVPLVISEDGIEIYDNYRE